MQEQNRREVAVAFLASDVNRFSINALTGAIEQDETLPITLAFPHPRDAQPEIERLLTRAETVVVAFSFMSSALLSTRQALERLQASLARDRDRVLFVAGGPPPPAGAAGTPPIGFAGGFFGPCERSRTEIFYRLAAPGRHLSPTRGIA